MKDFQRFLQLMWRVLVTIARFWGFDRAEGSASTQNYAVLTQSKRRIESSHVSRQKSLMPSSWTATGSARASWINCNTVATGRGPVFTSSTAEAKPHDPNKYFNRRAEVWGLAAEWLKAGAQIPDDPELEVDLTGPQYGYSNKSQIQLEKKEDMKSRGLTSPDLGDTLAMTFHISVNAKLREQKEWFEQYQNYRYKNDKSADAWMA